MRLKLILIPLLLSACSTVPAGGYQGYLERRGVTNITPEKFDHCYNYGCKNIAHVSLTDKDWKEIKRLFKPTPKKAEDEREQITKAIGLLETKVGALTGTDVDIHGTFKKLGPGQLDCVDESTNTTIYLKLLEDKGWLKFHTLGPPAVRIPIIHSGGWPHQTATIINLQENEQYAVDSWFYDNGAPAVVLPIKIWKDGWKPEDR